MIKSIIFLTSYFTIYVLVVVLCLWESLAFLGVIYVTRKECKSLKVT